MMFISVYKYAEVNIVGKTLILCEKPSQALDFSKGLGEAFTKGDGCYESSSYVICNARGHLIEL